MGNFPCTQMTFAKVNNESVERAVSSPKGDQGVACFPVGVQVEI